MLRSVLNRAVGRVSSHIRSSSILLSYPEPISIDSLIVPLRYDILVRRDYFDFFSREIATYTEDFDEYMRRVRRHPYAVWFREVAARQFHPHYLTSEARFERELRSRVRRSAELFFSFNKNGFDSRYPVRLKSGAQILPTSTGKQVRASLFAGDGCHRLALLLLAGRHQLEPHEYLVTWSPTFRPRDITSLLIKAGALDAAAYYSFLSRRYADVPCTDWQQLHAHVRVRCPEHLPELESLVGIDQGLLQPASG